MIAYTEVASNKRKTALLITSFLVVVIALGFVFDLAYNNPAILVLAVVVAVGSALFSYFFSDRITLAISDAQPVSLQSNPQLYNVVENLCIAAGLPMPRIYIINDPAMNAFATGRDPKHAVVCVTAGLLQSMDKTELEGVIAHELSHVGNYDIRLSTIVVVLVGLITLMSDWFLRFTIFGGGKRRGSGNGGDQLQIIFFIAGLVLAIISPIIAVVIQLAVSRKREYLADASGALLTRYPEGLASALEKISQHDLAMSEANKATAHLYFVNPLSLSDNQAASSQNGRTGGGWLAGLFNTHPPIQDRIKKLREMNLG